MTDKTYMVGFKPPKIGARHLTSASAEIHGDDLVFLNSDRQLVALFLLETVESWTVSNLPNGFSQLVERGGSGSWTEDR